MAKASTTAAAGDASTATKSKYETMIVGVPKAHKEKKTQLEHLATKLNCKPSALVWAAIGALLANPPKAAPEGATVSTGSAAGFWTVPITDQKGKGKDYEIVEVDSRSEVSNGRTFFRYDRDDDKSRNRALAQAQKAAQYDLKLLGLGDGKEVKVRKA